MPRAANSQGAQSLDGALASDAAVVHRTKVTRGRLINQFKERRNERLMDRS